MDNLMVEQTLAAIVQVMQINTARLDDGSLVYKKGQFTITSKGAVFEPHEALDVYISKASDPGEGLDRYMTDTDIAHTFAELARVLDDRQRMN